MSPRGRKTAFPRITDTVRRNLNIPRHLDDKMLTIRTAYGYTIQGVYINAVQQYVETSPVMELALKVFEMQEAMAETLKRLAQAHELIRKDVADLRAEVERRDPLDDGR